MVTRSCGVLNADTKCEEAGGTTICNCDSDLCNSARKPGLNLMVAFIFIVFGRMLFLSLIHI